MPQPTDLSVKVRLLRFETSWELVTASLLLFFNCFWFIAKVVLVVYLPASLLREGLFALTDSESADHYDDLIDMVFDALITPAILMGIVQYMKNKTFPTLREAYGFGWAKWGLVWARTFKAECLALLGSLMLVWPGILAGIAYALVPYAVCFESQTQKSSLRRSRELTLGYRWRIVWTGLLFALPVYAFNSIPELWVTSVPLALPVTLLIKAMNIFINCLANILAESLVVAYLLLYLKSVNDKSPRPRESWWLGWAK